MTTIPTYDLIATTTLAATGQPSFANIPQTYRDLILLVDAQTTDSSIDVFLRFNGDSGSNYTRVTMFGTGSTSGSNVQTTTYVPVSYPVNSARVAIQVSIMDYSATNKHKTLLSRSGQANSAVDAWAGRWANTAAITSFGMAPVSGNFQAGSTFSLYGIAA
jgi:hypothetical protein